MKRLLKLFFGLAAIMALVPFTGCEHIDNKAVPRYNVHIDLSNYAMWNTYGVHGAGDYTIFNVTKHLPSNFPYNVNTFTGYGGVLLMMGLEGPMAYDLACPVEISQDITLSIDSDKLEAVCPRCGSRFNPFMGDGGPISGVAINNKVGMRQYRVNPAGGGYIITN